MSSCTVFWGFDGTLASREGTWASVLLEAVHEVDPTGGTSVDELAAVVDKGFPDHGPSGLRFYPSASAWWSATSTVLRDACRHAGISDSTAARAADAVPQIYYRPRSWYVLPGAVAALRATVRAGLHNVVLSNHAPELPQLVADLGLEPYLWRTLTSAALGVEKPDPEIFRLAQRICAASPDSWMVGDNPNVDVEGARTVGMRALLVHRVVEDTPARSLISAAGLVVRACGHRES